VIDCTEARGLIGADLLGRLEPGDRARMEEHLRRCPGCAQRRAELAAVVEMVDLAGPPQAAEVPEGLEERLVARGVAELSPKPRRRRRIGLPRALSGRSALAGLVAGAAVAVALLAAFGLLNRSTSGAPGATSWKVNLVATRRAPTAKAVVYLMNGPRGDTIALQAQGLPALKRGDRCVVWVAGKSVSFSAGTIQITRGWATAILRTQHPAVHGSTIFVLIVPAHGGRPMPVLKGRV
jgi:predicted anti-sigma-YlaC factor YlaD